MSAAHPASAPGASPAVERKGQRSRRHILDTARGVFADVGYERATIRGIAAAARVDKSSIVQYFGTKQNLFREAVQWTVPIDRMLGATPADTAENLARGILAGWSTDPNRPMAVLLRTSMTSDDAADILRDQLTSHVFPAVAAVVDAPDARLRVALLNSMLMGVASQRYLIGLPDLRDVDTEEILRLIIPVVRALLDPEVSEVTVPLPAASSGTARKHAAAATPRTEARS